MKIPTTCGSARSTSVQAEPVQIVTGAWNVHVGDYVPAALHGALSARRREDRQRASCAALSPNGMLCSPKELGMTAEHDFPYAVITPAAILNDYHPIDKDKPSIPADIKPGDKVYGPVVAARVLECAPLGDGTFHTCLDLGNATAVPDTRCSNLHEGDLVAYNTKSDTICTLEDLHARAGGVPPLHRRRHLCLTGRGRRAGPQHGAHPRL